MENGEITILFADDIAFLKKYKYKLNGKMIKDAKSKAEKETQIFLNKLENWMGDWRLSLAPKKCSEITFSKAQKVNNDKLNIKLYGESIVEEKNPKFLGIIFDCRLNFVAHCEGVKKKIGDRLNLLKILSYDKTWRLPEHTLTNMYKSLVLSVIDYASITSGCLTEKTKHDYEVMQNNALRIIQKKSLLDKIPSETLRENSQVESIETRHKFLLEGYYEKALVSGNPLIKKVFEGYKMFKSREWISESLAKEGGTINEGVLTLIRSHNILSLKKKELYPTTLCQTNPIIIDLILDSYGVIEGT